MRSARSSRWRATWPGAGRVARSGRRRRFPERPLLHALVPPPKLDGALVADRGFGPTAPRRRDGRLAGGGAGRAELRAPRRRQRANQGEPTELAVVERSMTSPTRAGVQRARLASRRRRAASWRRAARQGRARRAEVPPRVRRRRVRGRSRSRDRRRRTAARRRGGDADARRSRRCAHASDGRDAGAGVEEVPTAAAVQERFCKDFERPSRGCAAWLPCVIRAETAKIAVTM